MKRELSVRFVIWLAVTIGFLLWMLVLGDNTLIDKRRLRNRVNELERQEDYYRARAAEDSAFLENLRDDRFLEKYAREKFYLRREGEEVYILPE